MSQKDDFWIVRKKREQTHTHKKNKKKTKKNRGGVLCVFPGVLVVCGWWWEHVPYHHQTGRRWNTAKVQRCSKWWRCRVRVIRYLNSNSRMSHQWNVAEQLEVSEEETECTWLYKFFILVSSANDMVGDRRRTNDHHFIKPVLSLLTLSKLLCFLGDFFFLKETRKRPG